MSDEFPYLTGLADEDLIKLYGACAQELENRNKLALCKKELRKIIHSQRAQDFHTPESLLKFDRGKIRRHPKQSILINFLQEDWSSLFDSGNMDSERKYYVYYHTDPSKPNMRFSRDGESVVFTGRPFYVGKGCGNRYKSKLRNRSHLSVITRLKEEERVSEDEIFHIFKDGLTELEAFELEAKLVTFFGCRSEVKRNKTHFHGMKGGLLINTDPCRRPDCVENMIASGFSGERKNGGLY